MHEEEVYVFVIEIFLAIPGAVALQRSRLVNSSKRAGLNCPDQRFRLAVLELALEMDEGGGMIALSPQ